MEDKKTIDDLVSRRAQKQHQLAAIHREIQESQRQAAIVILDLVGSTSLKQKAANADWLGFIYEFIQTVSDHVQKINGTLVKRMGDGLLAIR